MLVKGNGSHLTKTKDVNVRNRISHIFVEEKKSCLVKRPYLKVSNGDNRSQIALDVLNPVPNNQESSSPLSKLKISNSSKSNKGNK